MAVIRLDQIPGQINDPRLDDYRNVSDGELLRRSNLFVAEGRFVVRRLLSSGHRVVSLLLSDASLSSLQNEFRDQLEQLPVYVGSTPMLADIVGFNFHRGCLALAQRPADAAVKEVVRGASLVLVLEGVTDADNVGSAFRNAAAFGVDGVLLAGCCDPFYRKAIRTSMGHVLEMPNARVDDVRHVVASLQADGFAVVALTPAPDATPIADFARARASGGKIALLAGSEADGLSADVLGAADARVRIPMRGDVDSLNVSTAIGIALDRLVNR